MAATQLFWREGYTNVGTRQVEEETGITRFTLQTTYGGKLALFLAVLDHYLDLFENGGAPAPDIGSLNELALWFEGFATPSSNADMACFGCLMLNSIAEFGATNPEVSKRAERYFSLLRSRLIVGLQRLQKQGAVKGDLNIPHQVELLLGSVIGMNIIVRSAGQSAAANALATATGTTIRSWATGLVT